MVFYLISNSKLVAFVKLFMLCVATAVCAMYLSTSPVKAEDTYGSFDPSTGNYSYYEERGFTRPRQEETYGQMRQREQASRQEQQQERSNNQPDASTSKEPAYKDNYTVITPNGQTFCQRSFGNTVYCQ